MGVRTIDERMVNSKFLVLFGPIGPHANLMKVETLYIHTYDSYRGVAISYTISLAKRGTWTAGLSLMSSGYVISLTLAPAFITEVPRGSHSSKASLV